MQRVRILVFIALCTALAIIPFRANAVTSLPEANNSGGYTIGSGDILEISVWKNADLSRQLPVLPDGTISLPLLGKFLVAGMTVEKISDELSKKLAQFMHEPVVTVSVVQPNSMVIYVIGKVNNPGRFPLDRQVDVLQALAMAGGLNTFADSEEIKVFRKANGDRRIYTFDYEAVSKGRNLHDNIYLERGDTIVVR